MVVVGVLGRGTRELKGEEAPPELLQPLRRFAEDDKAADRLPVLVRVSVVDGEGHWLRCVEGKKETGEIIK